MATTDDLEVCGQAELTAFKAALCEAGRPDLAAMGWRTKVSDAEQPRLEFRIDFFSHGPGWTQGVDDELLARAWALAHTLHDRRAHWWIADDGWARVCCPGCRLRETAWMNCPTHPL